MKIRQEDNLILTNSTNEKKFTIQASAKAFQILSSALYSRKIEAIIRELGCNAADSHIQAGYPDRPFVVHLPNTWEPEFYVEDFGIGLDADDVENIYTSYFTSTKTESNDVTGGFGLGSKTPFSYCDSFNIRTRKNGFEYHFNAYINMQGEPATTLLSQTATDEPNGVRVSVPVKVTDYGQFRTDANTVYKWFAVVPTITGGSGELTIDNSKAQRLAKEGSFWSEYSKDGWNKNSITAVMGNVSYLVPKVAETFSAHFNDSERKFFEHNSLFIQFDIGDLDVAASRETISFDEDTEKAFIKRVKEVIANFCAATQVRLDTEITTVQDAVALVASEVGAWAHSMFNYKGKTIYEWSSKNFVTWLRDSIDESGPDGDVEFDNYYFARTRKGTVKRHALDYIGGYTFGKLEGKKIVILVGDDKGFQTIARQLCVMDYGLYGVFFVNKMVEDKVKDELFETFGDYLEFEVAADLIAADKARRKAERDAAKALAGPTARKAVVARIGRDSLRASRVFELTTDPTTGYISYNFHERHVINETHMDNKRALLLVERYNEASIPAKHPTRTTHTEQNLLLTTTGESGLYHFCRVFKIDTLVIIKPEMQKKAEKMFDGKYLTEVSDVDVDFVQAVTLRSNLSLMDYEEPVRSLVDKHVSYGPESLTDVLVANIEAHITANPNGELATALNMIKPLKSWDSFNYIPSFIRDTANAPDFSASKCADKVRRTVESLYEDLRKDYPMAFLDGVEDGHELEEYIYYMDKIREHDLLIKYDAVKEVEEPVVELLEAA